MWNRAVALAILLLFVASVRADVVVMQNGDRLTGTVDSISGGRVLIDTEYAGLVAVDVSAVQANLLQQAIQLRYLQTLVEIAGDKSSTIVFPLPMDMMDKLRPGSG